MHNLKSLGLLFSVALCLMAATASSAQATGNWRIEGANIAAEKTIVSEEDTMFKFVVTADNVEILCNEFSIDSGKLFVSAASLMRMLFRECSTFSITPALKELPECKPNFNPETGTSEIVMLAKGLLILHNNKTYNLMSPDVGSSYGNVLFLPECPLPGVVKIEGTFVLKDCAGDLATEAVRHLVEQAATTLFTSDVLKFNNQVLKIEGSAWLKLGGGDAGKVWSGLS